MKTVDKDEFIVDHLESEIEEWMAEDLQKLLENDSELRQNLGRYQAVRKRLAEPDMKSVQLPESPQYWENLHDKIMSQAQGGRRTVVQIRSRSLLKLLPNRSLSFAASVALLVVGGWAILSFIDDRRISPEGVVAVQTSEQGSSTDRLLLETSAKEPDTLLFGSSEPDLILDAAVMKLDNLPDSDVNDLLNSFIE